MKIALCFIISYEHTLNKEQLWIDWIEPNKDIINVYFHYKDFRKIKSNWIKSHTIPSNLIQSTSYYNVVPAYMALMSYAYEHDTNNVWFCMLTESCAPIISPENFRKMFFNHFQASIITCKPAYWDIKLHQRANLRLLSKEYWLANDPWFTLTRDHVKKCILFLTLKTKIYYQINLGGLANESMFAIILQTFNEISETSGKLINSCSTISDWQRMSSPTSPYLFKDPTDENINVIKKLIQENKYAMFLRKVDKEFPTETLQHIMGTDFNHKYEILHNQAIHNHSKYVSIRFFMLVLISLYFIAFCFTKINVHTQ